MKIARRAYFLMLASLISVSLVGCTKISVTGSKSGAGAPAGGATPGGPTAAASNAAKQPPMDVPWDVTFSYKGEQRSSEIEFTRKGDTLGGNGTDADGRAFAVHDGIITGQAVEFKKVYADLDPSSEPVLYQGTLTYEQSADYTGWLMSGHYKVVVNGQGIDDKWIAMPRVPEQPAAAVAPPPAATGNPTTLASAENGGEDPAAISEDTSGDPPHLSGMYMGSYQFNFKRIKCKMWLEQDGAMVRGHGVDINTNEHFSIPRGWYKYPKLTIIRKYEKGKNAAASREIRFEGKVAKGLSIKGETQYGGDWDAQIVR